MTVSRHPESTGALRELLKKRAQLVVRIPDATPTRATILRQKAHFWEAATRPYLTDIDLRLEPELADEIVVRSTSDLLALSALRSASKWNRRLQIWEARVVIRALSFRDFAYIPHAHRLMDEDCSYTGIVAAAENVLPNERGTQSGHLAQEVVDVAAAFRQGFDRMIAYELSLNGPVTLPMPGQ